MPHPLRPGRVRAVTLTALIAVATALFIVFLPAERTRAQPTPPASEGAAPFFSDRLRADLDGDGVHEFLAPYDSYRRDTGVGAVRALRADGASALQIASGQVNDRFGYAAAFTPDLSGDGVPDVLVGAPLGFSGEAQTGGAYLYSGADGTLLRSWAGEPDSKFGKSVAFVGDVSGDGVGDLAIGGFVLTGAGAPYGSLHLVSGADGAVFRTIVGEQADDGFGHAAAGVDDVNGDGIGDLMVSASLAVNAGGARGRMYVFAGAGAEVDPAAHGAEEALAIIANSSLSGARFGRWILPGVDFDGDGETEVAIVSERGNAVVGFTAEILAWSGMESALSPYEGAIVTDAIDATLAPGEFILAGASDALGAGRARRLTGVAPAPLTGDMNGDGVVDADDLEGLAMALSEGDPSGDLDGDGNLDAADLRRGMNAMLWSGTGGEVATGSGEADGDDPVAQAVELEGPDDEDPCNDETFVGLGGDLGPDCEGNGTAGGGLFGIYFYTGSGGYTANRPPPDSDSDTAPDDSDDSDGSDDSNHLQNESLGMFSESHKTEYERDPASNQGAGAATCQPVMLATGVKRELETDLLVSLPGRDFELVRRYDSAMVEYRRDRAWMIGAGWATSGDGWLEWRASRFGAIANGDFVALQSPGAQFDPTQAHIRITRFPDQTGSQFLAPRSEAANIDPVLGYNPKFYTPYLPTSASVRESQYTLGGVTFRVWVYERAGEGQVLYYNTRNHTNPGLQALNGRVVHERDEFGNVWTYSYMSATLASGDFDEPRVHRIYLNGTTKSDALAYVEFIYDGGISIATPGTGRLIRVDVHRKQGSSWDNITQYVKYTYADDLSIHSQVSPDGDRLVLVESGVQVNAPAASDSSAPAPIYHVRVTHYRYSGDGYLSHTYYPEQVEHFAEHYAQSVSPGKQAESLANVGIELALLSGGDSVAPGLTLTVNDLASKIVEYYGAENASGYSPGELKGRVRSELLQNGCGCSGASGQAIRIDFEYARRPIFDHQLAYQKYQPTIGGNGLEWVDAIRKIRRWSRVTVRKEYALAGSGDWVLQRRMRTWSEDRIFGQGWVTYYDPNLDGLQGGALIQANYFNWLPVPLTVANEVTEFDAAGNEGSSWRSFFEFEDHNPTNFKFEDYHPTNSYGPSAVESFNLDAHGLLVYDGEYDPDEDNPANPVDAVTFVPGALVEWQKVDELGRVKQRGVARVASDEGGRDNERQTLQMGLLNNDRGLRHGASGDA